MTTSSISNSQELQQIKHYTETHLGGIENHTSYWEQRKYQITKGSLQDRQEFYCFAVVKIKKDILEAFINNTNKDIVIKEEKKNKQ